MIQLITSLISFTIIYKYDISMWATVFIAMPVIYLIAELESNIRSNRIQLFIVTYLLTAMFTSYPMVQEISIKKSLLLSLTAVPSSYVFFLILDKRIMYQEK